MWAKITLGDEKQSRFEAIWSDSLGEKQEITHEEDTKRNIILTYFRAVTDFESAIFCFYRHV